MVLYGCAPRLEFSSGIDTDDQAQVAVEIPLPLRQSDVKGQIIEDCADMRAHQEAGLAHSALDRHSGLADPSDGSMIRGPVQEFQGKRKGIIPSETQHGSGHQVPGIS